MTDYATPPGTPAPPGHTTPGPEYDPGQVAWEQLVARREAATEQLLSAHDRMMDFLERANIPAQDETIVITPTMNPVESRERVQKATLSLGVYNPNPIIVYFSGIGSASANARSWSAPAESFIVVPIAAGLVEFGCDPTDLGDNNAVVQFLRFFTVQPAFLRQA
jgi:hypothetical protein